MKRLAMRSLWIAVFAGFGWLCGNFALPRVMPEKALEPRTRSGPGPAAKPDPLDAFLAGRSPVPRVDSLSHYQEHMAALEENLQMTPGRRKLERELLDGAPSDDLLMAILAEQNRVQFDRTVLAGLFKRLAERSPEEAMAVLEGWGSVEKLLPDDLSSLQRAVNLVWLKRDASAAVDHALRKAKEPGGGQSVISLMQDWSWVDPAAAMRGMVSICAGGPLDESAADAPFSAWLRADSAAARRWAEREAPEDWRPWLDKMVMETVPSAPSERLAWLENSASPSGSSLITQAWADWFSEDPGAAAARIGSLEANSPIATPGIWSSTGMDLDLKWIYDPKPRERLLSVLERIASEEARDRILAGFITARNRRDFGVASSLVKEIRNPEYKASICEELVDKQAGRDLETLTAWLNSQPGDAAREAAVVRLVTHLTPLDAASARSWAESLPAESPRRAAAEAILETASAASNP